MARPHATAEPDYMSERPVAFAGAGRIDCYRRGAFIWERKKLKPTVTSQPTSKAFDAALLRARAQAEAHARAAGG